MEFLQHRTQCNAMQRKKTTRKRKHTTVRGRQLTTTKNHKNKKHKNDWHIEVLCVQTKKNFSRKKFQPKKKAFFFTCDFGDLLTDAGKILSFVDLTVHTTTTPPHTTITITPPHHTFTPPHIHIHTTHCSLIKKKKKERKQRAHLNGINTVRGVRGRLGECNVFHNGAQVLFLNKLHANGDSTEPTPITPPPPPPSHHHHHPHPSHHHPHHHHHHHHTPPPTPTTPPPPPQGNVSQTFIHSSPL